MKQIKKLIFNIVMLILLVATVFFAWQSIATKKFIIKKAGSLQELKEEAEKKQTYFHRGVAKKT